MYDVMGFGQRYGHEGSFSFRVALVVQGRGVVGNEIESQIYRL